MCAPQMTKLQPQDFIFKSFNFCTMAWTPRGRRLEQVGVGCVWKEAGSAFPVNTGRAAGPGLLPQDLCSCFPGPGGAQTGSCLQ